MNDQRRQGRIARRGGCRWLGFTFGLRTGGCLERCGVRERCGKGRCESEGEEIKGRGEGDERRRVLRWDIGEWFHACIPRTPWATKERCARDPSGIIEYHLPLCSFLSLFFSARRWVQTRIGYPPVYACAVTNARARSSVDGVKEEVWRQESAHLRSRNAVHLWQPSHYAFCPSAPYARDFMWPAHTYSIRVHYATSSIPVESVVHRRAVKELWKRFRGSPARMRRAALVPWRIAVRWIVRTRCLRHNLSSIQMRNDIT